MKFNSSINICLINFLKRSLLPIFFLIASYCMVSAQPIEYPKHPMKDIYQERLTENLVMSSGLSPADWLESFWEKFDRLTNLLTVMIAQAPPDIQEHMRDIEVYMDQVRAELEQHEPPRRQVVFVSSIEDINPRHGCAGELMTILGTDFWVVEESETVRPTVIHPSSRALMLPAEQGHRLVKDFISCTETKIELTIPWWARKGYIGITDAPLQANWRHFLVRVDTHYQTFATLLRRYYDIGFDLPRNVSPPILYPTTTAYNLFEGTIPEIVFRIRETGRGRVNASYAETEPGCVVKLFWSVEHADSIKVMEVSFTGMDVAYSLSQEEVLQEKTLYEGYGTGAYLIELPQNPSLPSLHPTLYHHALYGEYKFALEATNRCGTAVEFVRLKVVVPPIRVWTINMDDQAGNWTSRTSNIANKVADRDNNKWGKASDLFGFNECKHKDDTDYLRARQRGSAKSMLFWGLSVT